MSLFCHLNLKLTVVSSSLHINDRGYSTVWLVISCSRAFTYRVVQFVGWFECIVQIIQWFHIHFTTWDLLHCYTVTANINIDLLNTYKLIVLIYKLNYFFFGHSWTMFRLFFLVFFFSSKYWKVQYLNFEWC